MNLISNEAAESRDVGDVEPQGLSTDRLEDVVFFRTKENVSARFREGDLDELDR